MSTVDYLPDPRLEGLARELPLSLEERTLRLTPEAIRRLLDPGWKSVFEQTMKHLGASEGSLWWHDLHGECLIPCYNNGPQAEELYGHRQPLSRGIISSVFISQLGTCESNVYKNSHHDPAANERLRVVTCHLAAVPFFFAHEVRGVVSAVKLRSVSAEPVTDPPPFVPSTLESLNTTAGVLATLLESTLIKSLLGLR